MSNKLAKKKKPRNKIINVLRSFRKTEDLLWSKIERNYQPQNIEATKEDLLEIISDLKNLRPKSSQFKNIFAYYKSGKYRENGKFAKSANPSSKTRIAKWEINSARYEWKFRGKKLYDGPELCSPRKSKLSVYSVSGGLPGTKRR